MATDSSFLAPAASLLSEWVYLQDWDRARPVEDQLVQRFPDDDRSHLYAGLVDHQSGHDSAAVIEFGRAARIMPDSVAAVFNDVTGLLRPDQLAALNALVSAVF